MCELLISHTNTTFRRWTGLELDDIEDNTIVCGMKFKAQKLPDNYLEFVRLTALDPSVERR